MANVAGSVSMSVIVTAHRRSAYLRAAVESALCQTLPRSQYEVVATKDFADPDLDRFLEETGVRVIPYQGDELGLMYLRAASEAEGEVLLFLDDDDLFEPSKLAVTARIFGEDPSL
ncbi:cell wall biosynthesis glycosyltransferase, partial [mine drainage metagenome]